MVRRGPLLALIMASLLVNGAAIAEGANISLAYPGARAMPMGRGLAINGVSAATSYFLTPDPLPVVVNHYIEAIAGAGLALSMAVGPVQATLLGLSPTGKVKVSVSLYRHGERTAVFPSRMAVEQVLAGSGKARGDLPVMPGARGLTTLTARDPAGPTDTTTYVNDEALARNVAFYLSEMSSRGWKRDRRLEGSGGTSVVLRFAKNNAECTVSLSWDQRTNQTLVTLHRSGR